MKLSQAALNAMPEASRLRKLLAAELNVDLRTIDSHADSNKDNSILTTVKAVRVIAKETGLIQDEIVTEERAHAA